MGLVIHIEAQCYKRNQENHANHQDYLAKQLNAINLPLCFSLLTLLNDRVNFEDRLSQFIAEYNLLGDIQFDN